MDTVLWARAGAGLMFLSVALGAFAAHALKGSLAGEMQAVFETGVRYQAYHALGLLAAAWMGERFPGRFAGAAGLCFMAGIVLFSGSLYALSLSGIRRFGAVTPLGGVLLLAGWALLAATPTRS